MDEIKVLLVDDEEELISAWIERLDLRGIYAKGTTNGNDAINWIKEEKYDVVILDIKMPGIDGFEIMKHIQTERPDLPIIIITGHQFTNEDEKGKIEGAFDCLVKPVNIEILIDKIMEAVRD